MDRQVEEAKEVRWVLGFDAECHACTELAQQILILSDGTLEGRGLCECEVRRWRRQIFGDNAPWAPTLFAVDGDRVRAWTGRRMVFRLGRLLGPGKAWQVAQLLAGQSSLADPNAAADPKRRQLMKGLGAAGLALALASGKGTLFVRPAAAIDTTATLVTISGLEFLNLQEEAQGNSEYQKLYSYFENRNFFWDGDKGVGFVDQGVRRRTGLLSAFHNPSTGERLEIDYVKESGQPNHAIALDSPGSFTNRVSYLMYVDHNGTIQKVVNTSANGVPALRAFPAELAETLEEARSLNLDFPWPGLPSKCDICKAACKLPLDALYGVAGCGVICGALIETVVGTVACLFACSEVVTEIASHGCDYACSAAEYC